MIKTLQKKFTVTAMIAISVLIVVLLGTVNVMNIWRVGNENSRILEMLVRDEGVHPGENSGPDNEEKINDYENIDSLDVPEGSNFGEMNDFPESTASDEPFFEGSSDTSANPHSAPGKHDIFNPPITEDTAMSARYFLVLVDNNNQVVYTDVSRISSVTEDEAKVYVEDILRGGKSSGKMNSFIYAVEESRDGQGKIVVFLNVSNQSRSILAVLLTSIAIGAVCWVLMLLLVIILSKKAIRPIAVNMEKQKRFVTDAGHEIKTPLAIILANTDAMELHNGENKWSRNIRTQTKRLSGLMQNLLTLSKMDENGQRIVMQEIDMSMLVREGADSFIEPARLKGVTIDADIPSGVMVNANKENMVQLVSILIDNAVKYSKANGTIEVALQHSGKGFVLKTRNTCDALPDAEAEQLFDRFYRGDAARTQKSGGYGIGLSVARAIVEAHKGTISAEYGKGDTIIFTVKI